MFAKLEAKKIKHTREYPPSQLTPATTDSSSGTPPRNGVTPQKQKVVLPTPPTSTHSSNSPCQIQRASTDTLSSIEQEKLWYHNKGYDFTRHFTKVAIKNQVKFYNQLLSIQREKIRRHRLKAKANREMEAKIDYRKLTRQTEKQCRQLRKLNSKRRKELRQLEYNLAIIRNCAIDSYPIVRLKRCNLKSLGLPADSNQKAQKQQGDKQDETPEKENQLKNEKLFKEEKLLLEKKIKPEKERKKKKKLKESKKGREEIKKRKSLEESEEKAKKKKKQLKKKSKSLEEPLRMEKRERLRTADKLKEKDKKPKAEKAKREKKPLKEKSKRSEEHIPTEDMERREPAEELQEEHRLEEQKSGQLEAQKQPPQNRKRRKRRRAHSVWSHVKSRKKRHPQIEGPIEELDADSRPEIEPVAEEPEPSAEEVPSAIFEEQDQDMVPEVGNELEVPPASLEPGELADETSRLLSPANDLDQVTSHVPVYLLNGESRDVSSPPPSSQLSASEGFRLE